MEGIYFTLFGAIPYSLSNAMRDKSHTVPIPLPEKVNVPSAGFLWLPEALLRIKGRIS